MDRYLDLRFQGRYEVVGVIRGYGPCHVFDAEGVCPHIFYDLRLLYKIIDVEYGAPQPLLRQRKGDGALYVLPCLLNCLESDDKISLIIEGVEDPEYLDPYLGR